MIGKSDVFGVGVVRRDELDRDLEDVGLVGVVGNVVDDP